MTAPGANIRPTDRSPDVPENVVRDHLARYQIVLGEATPVAVVCIKGWDKIGLAGAESGKNLVGVYDDPMAVVTLTSYRVFMGNADPSRTLPERAVLVAPQIIEFQAGVHNRSRPKEDRRPAFIQASPVTIQRYGADGKLGPEIKDQWIGCNNHDGSVTTTGSAACQTVPPEQWMDYAAEILRPFKIGIEEWPTVLTRVRNGQDVPEHWLKVRFPYLLLPS